MKMRLRGAVFCFSCVGLSLVLLGCQGSSDSGGGASGTKPIVEPRKPGDSTPGLREEGKLPKEFRQ